MNTEHQSCHRPQCQRPALPIDTIQRNRANRRDAFALRPGIISDDPVSFAQPPLANTIFHNKRVIPEDLLLLPLLHTRNNEGPFATEDTSLHPRGSLWFRRDLSGWLGVADEDGEHTSDCDED